MEKILKLQGHEIPALGFGTWNLTGKDCRIAVNDALRMGYRHIDTARAYSNETEVGAGIKDSGINREDFYLVTKIATDELKPEKIQKVGEDSLKNLQVDYVDLLLIHWPVPNMDLKGILEEMMKLKDAGKIRSIGVSNFSPKLVKEALSIAPIINNQVEFHPFHPQEENLKTAKENNMFVTAYTPLGKGKVLKNEIINEIAQNHGKEPSQIGLRWLLQQGQVAVIPKAASEKHRRTNLDLFSFELSNEEMQQITEIYEHHTV